MSERKPCNRCERAIDGWSKICPFCNWDQTQAAPPPEAVPQQKMAVQYVPEDDIREQIKRKGLFAGAGVLVLIASFLIGMVINSDDTPDDAPEPLTEQAQAQKVAPVRRADTPLVPTNERGGMEQPITSAPVSGAPQDPNAPSAYDRSDATAVSSVEYNDLAKRAKAERERMSVVVDPRSLTGAAYAQAQRPVVRRPAPPTRQQQAAGLPGTVPQPPPLNSTVPETAAPPQQSAPPQVADAPRARRALRTRPVPISQPLPRINGTGTARLTLIIGSDGRVRDINIEKALSRNTADLVAAVQRWRFKPATEDGEPITAPYSVDISFGDR